MLAHRSADFSFPSDHAVMAGTARGRAAAGFPGTRRTCHGRGAGRWTAFFLAVMPALAGAARMPYPKFFAWNAAGGITWGATVVLLGYAAGASYARVEKTLGRHAAAVVLALVVLAVVVWRIRRGRALAPATAGE